MKDDCKKKKPMKNKYKKHGRPIKDNTLKTKWNYWKRYWTEKSKKKIIKRFQKKLKENVKLWKRFKNKMKCQRGTKPVNNSNPISISNFWLGFLWVTCKNQFEIVELVQEQTPTALVWARRNKTNKILLNFL